MTKFTIHMKDGGSGIALRSYDTLGHDMVSRDHRFIIVGLKGDDYILYVFGLDCFVLLRSSFFEDGLSLKSKICVVRSINE